MKTLILGMGNPILRDDRIGLRVVEELRGHCFGSEVRLEETTLSGLSLLDYLVGYDRVVLVDAIQTGGPPGKVYRLTPGDFLARDASPHLHNIDFFQTLRLSGEFVPDLPRDVMIVAVEAEDVSNFGEDLTPEVEKAVPSAVEEVLAVLKV